MVAVGCGCGGVLVLALAGAFLFWMDAREPSVLAGSLDFRVRLASEDGDGPIDGELLVARFAEAGLDAEVADAGRGYVELVVRGVRDEAVVRALVAQNDLAFQLEAEDAAAVTPPPEAGAAPLRHEVETLSRGAIPVWIGPDASSLGPLLAAVRAAGRDPAIECGDDPMGPRECRLRILETDRVLTGAHVAAAEVTIDDATGRPNVRVELDAEGARRFGEVTGRAVQRRLAILVDGRVVSMPVIMEPITGGRAQITLGSGASMEEALREAQALAIALRVRPLSARWSVDAVTPGG